MRIGVDCRLAGTRHAGIGRYIENLVRRLPAEAKQNSKNIEWVFFFFDAQQVESVLGDISKNPLVKIVLVPIRHYTLAEQLILPFYLYKERLELLHIPHFNAPVLYRKKIVITIHDLLWHQQKGSSVTTLSPVMYWGKYYFYHLVAWSAIWHASSILVPAETVKKIVTQLYPYSKQKIHVTKEGVPTALGLTPKKIVLTGEKSPYLLFVGSLYPHKNVELLVRALKILPKYTLKIAGSRSVFYENIHSEALKEGVSDRVKHLGYQSDDQLSLLYRNASALVQPSLSEGFGLTGLEAMIFNTPVLASDIPIFKEIYQDGAVFFDPSSITSFAESVAMIENRKSRADILVRAQKVANQYSWETMTKQTLEWYKIALNNA
jgi:glycosyltransferase involved in cell wall biosynthesis